MKYPDKTAYGDAGEFFFAYQIARVLKWPCRLFDIDIGIDAQVEILDDEGNSTGKFVAFQIKTTSIEKHAACRHVRKKQLSYWQSLDLPVFVVLVDLSKETLYLHQISGRENYTTTEKGWVRIDFDTANDQFSESSAALIRAAADKVALVAIREYLTPVRKGIDSIREELQRAEDTPEPAVLIEIMLERTTLRDQLARAEAIARNMRAGEDECLEVEGQLEEALSELRQFMKRYGMQFDWDDRKYGAGEISKFLGEKN